MRCPKRHAEWFENGRVLVLNFIDIDNPRESSPQYHRRNSTENRLAHNQAVSVPAELTFH